MSFKTLSEKLTASAHLGEEAVALFAKHWSRHKKLRPKEVLLDFDRQATHLYFIQDGCLRLFLVDDKGDEVNIGFGYGGSFLTSFQSFIEERPSTLRIEAILETNLLSIPKKDLAELMAESKAISSWYQAILEATLSGHIRRQVELLTLKPSERYEAFSKRSGHLLNAIPLKAIASYLMMSPETLSRIRGRIS